MSLVRAILAGLLLVGVIVFVWGFWDFATSVRAPANPELPGHADGIVALTGSNDRLEAAGRLLEQHKADRLLVSGVNRIVADRELIDILKVNDATARCCVDIGRGAEDTLGNASETAAWAHEHHYDQLILVTDDYHMPRSLTELSIALPNVEIVPYPVRTRWTDPAVWRSDLSAASRIGSEYVKYLMIRGREALIDLSSKKPNDDADAKK